MDATALFDNCSSIEPSRTPTNTWELLDEQFRRMLAPVSEGLNRDIFDTAEATESFTSVLHDQLIHHGLLKQEMQEGNIHRVRAIIRTGKRLAKQKAWNIRSSPREVSVNYCANRVPGGKKRPFMESARTLSSQIAPTFSSSNALTHFSELVQLQPIYHTGYS